MLAGHPRSQIREGAWRKGSFISSGKVRIHSGRSTFLRTLVRTVGSTRYMGITPVYGANVLLFIGQTMGETFGERIEEHNFGGGFQEDREHVEIYVGRLKGVSTPSSNEWRNEINWAEKLL